MLSNMLHLEVRFKAGCWELYLEVSCSLNICGCSSLILLFQTGTTLWPHSCNSLTDVFAVYPSICIYAYADWHVNQSRHCLPRFRHYFKMVTFEDSVFKQMCWDGHTSHFYVWNSCSLVLDLLHMTFNMFCRCFTTYLLIPKIYIQFLKIQKDCEIGPMILALL